MIHARARMTALAQEKGALGAAERSRTLSARTLFWISVSTTVMCALGAEYSARAIIGTPAGGDRPGKKRAANVVAVPKTASKLPPHASGRRSLFLLGNSHTYALPGLKKGDPLREDPGVTLIDDLANELERDHPTRSAATYYRVSNPNFLPFEMLTHVGYLLHHGYVPDVAIIGFTFRNVARDTALRHDLRRAYANDDFASGLKRALKSPEVGADPRIIEAIDGELRRVAFEDRADAARSDADRLDERIMEELGPHVVLIGESAGLRVRIFRSFAYQLDALLQNRSSKPDYEVIESDLVFNIACERALLELLKSKGVSVVYYFTPERSDLPPLISPERERAEDERFAAWARSEGAVVIDAREVVPNQYWGWESDTPDRSHFTEPGHELLAAFIAHHPDAQLLLSRLDLP
jgi:hypothetical protein